MKIYKIFIAGLLICLQVHAAAKVRIIEISGQVHVRRGLEEIWEPAGQGMLLEDLDTILSGEASKVVLRLDEELLFTLGGNAMLDVSDLRKITERELFLMLMSQKVGRIQTKGTTVPIQIANVSVVHGNPKSMQPGRFEVPEANLWVQEKNGAGALFQAGYYTNTVAKLVKMLNRYPECKDGGEMYGMLGKSFEALNQPGRAVEAYQTALDRYHQSDSGLQDKERLESIQMSLHRLKSE